MKAGKGRGQEERERESEREIERKNRSAGNRKKVNRRIGKP